jgi:plasmid stabilization system protein ParE
VSYSLHRSAERDLTNAFHFYKAEAGRGVAGRFLTEFERVVKILGEFPDIGAPTKDERRIYPLSGFPYSIIYRSALFGRHLFRQFLPAPSESDRF